MTRILIVDDREENRFLLRALLEGDGYVVDEARHGAEALIRARREAPQLVISDLLMPVMDGYTLLGHWKADERLRAIPFIVFTATYTEPKDQHLALDLGADAFLVKPVKHGPFLDRIREVLATPLAKVRSPVLQPEGEDTLLLNRHNEVLVRKLEARNEELRRADLGLERSQEELRAVYDQAPVPMCTLDSSRRVLYANRAFVDFTGVPEEELIRGRACGVFGCINASDHPDGCGFGPKCEGCGVRTALEDTLKTGRAHRDVEYRSTLVRGGQSRDVVLLGSTARVGDRPDPILLLCFQDISEREVTFEALAESERIYRTLFQDAEDGMGLAEVDTGILVDVNRALCRMVDRDKTELVGLPQSILHSPDSLTEGMSHTFRQRKAEDIGHAVVENLLTKRGRLIPVEIRAALIQMTGREYLLGIFRDITDRKRVELAINSLARRQEALLAAIPDIVVEVDTGKVYTWANEAGIEYFGEDVIGREASSYFEGEQATYQDMQPLFNGSEETVYLESWQKRKDGEKRLLGWWCRALKDDAGNVTGALSSARDITDQRRGEEDLKALNAELDARVAARTAELQAINKELESFSYSVSHDLRAPVRAMDGFATILQEEHGASLDEEGQRLLGIIRKNSHKMGQLIDALLQFSRLGRKAMTIREVDMETLAREALADQRAFHPDHPAQVELGPMPRARGDNILLKQVWENLFSNAFKFTQTVEQPRIEAGGRMEGGALVYWVKDNGVGFDMRYADNLFGVFKRLHSQEEFAGTGVGLATVQRTVFRHGGRVWAEGEVGQGATFYFSLPAGDKAEPGTRSKEKDDIA